MRKSLPILPLTLAIGLFWLPAAPAEDPKPLKPFNVPLNTSADEDEPHVSPDGLTLYYTVTSAKGKEEIFTARRRSLVQAWPSRGSVIEGYVATEADDRSAFQTGGREF